MDKYTDPATWNSFNPSGEVIVALFALSEIAEPLITQLSLSVPQEVKYRFLLWQPNALAMVLRQDSTNCLASCPKGYWEEGLPN